MSWSDRPVQLTRRGLLAATGVLLAGCGFAPVYGTGGVGGVLRDRTAFDTPATPEGFRLGRRLEQRLGRAAAPAYRAQIALRIEREAVAITQDGATTRYTLPGTADWVLRTETEGTLLAQGQAHAFTSYSATGSTVATQAAEDDARDRLAVILADRLVMRLMAAAATAGLAP